MDTPELGVLRSWHLLDTVSRQSHINPHCPTQQKRCDASMPYNRGPSVNTSCPNPMPFWVLTLPKHNIALSHKVSKMGQNS